MHRTARPSFALCLTFAAVVGLTACGSGKKAIDTTVAASTAETTAPAAADSTLAEPPSETAADTTVAAAPALSRDEVIARADAICTQVRTDMSAVPAPASFATAGPSLQKMLGISETGVAALRALPVAGSDQNTLNSLVSMLEAANRSLKAAVDATSAGDEAAANTAGDAYSAKVVAFAEAAKAAGFQACGQTGPTATTTETAAPTSSEAAVPAATGDTKFALVDLGTTLKAIPGFDYVALDKAIQSQLIDGFAADPNVVSLVDAVGTSVVTNKTDRALLIFLRLKRPLVGKELQDFVGGVVGNGTDVEQGKVAGTRGWSYVDSSGSRAFVTVRNNTAILSLADSTDVLASVVSGLFNANPDL